MNDIISESNSFLNNKRINIKTIKTIYSKRDDELQIKQYESNLNQIHQQIEYLKERIKETSDIDTKNNINFKIDELTLEVLEIEHNIQTNLEFINNYTDKLE